MKYSHKIKFTNRKAEYTSILTQKSPQDNKNRAEYQGWFSARYDYM